MTTLTPVGAVTRLGRRADGKRFHYATFNEEGLDLPPGTVLYTLPASKIKPRNQNGLNDNQPHPQILAQTLG